MKDLPRQYMLATLLFAIAFTALPAAPAGAQVGDDLYIFGFFQGQYRYSNEQGITSPDQISSFSLQQLNAFVMKDFSPTLGAFVNAEITNTFASDRQWGSLRIEEAWVRYNQSSRFSLRAGLLVPTFNNLNDVKNRTPLLPYVFRPAAYESSFSSIFNIDAFAPQQAFLQANGALPLGTTRIDYAAYVGNNSSEYTAQGPIGSAVSGTDLSLAKLVGGRVGLRWRTLKAGVSGSYDQARSHYDIAETLNQSPAAIAQFSAMLGQPLDAITPEMLQMAGMPTAIFLDEVDRTRLGADASFFRGSLFGEAEFIHVSHTMNDVHRTALAVGGQATNGFIRDNLNMQFYYALLGYNFGVRAFAYGTYNYVQDNSNTVQAAGLDFYSVGGGFRPVDGIVLKTQYIIGGTRENPIMDYRTNTVFAAVSVQF